MLYYTAAYFAGLLFTMFLQGRVFSDWKTKWEDSPVLLLHAIGWPFALLAYSGWGALWLGGKLRPKTKEERDMVSVETAMLDALERVRWFRIKVLATLYVVAAIVTYGHSAAAKQVEVDALWCYPYITQTQPDGTVVQQIDTRAKVECSEKPVVGDVAAFGAVLWPLYWSWVIWE